MLRAFAARDRELKRAMTLHGMTTPETLLPSANSAGRRWNAILT